MNLLHKHLSIMLNHPENVIKSILDSKTDSPKRSNAYIAKMISKELSVELIGDDVHEILSKAKELIDKQEEWFSDLSDQIEKKKKSWEFNEATHTYTIWARVTNIKTWEKYLKAFPISLEKLDQVWQAFSKYGKNWSSTKCQQYFKIIPEVWHILKTMWLYKDWHILSPVSMDKAEKNWKIDEVIHNATLENYQDKYVDKYADADLQVLKKEYKKMAKIFGSWKSFFDSFRDNINYREPIKPAKLPKFKKNREILHLIIADIHNGKTEKLDWVTIKERMYETLQYALWHSATNVDVAFLWDLTETTIPWGYHIWQVEWMRGVYWTDLIMDTANLIEWFFYELYKSWKKVTGHLMWWNHDKIVGNSNYDRPRSIAIIIYELVKRWLSQCKMDLQIIEDTVGSWETEDFNMIAIHGDQWMDKIDPEKMAWKYAKTNWKHVIFLSWDKHQTWMKDWKDCTHIKVQAIAWKNHYDKDNAMHGDPGFVIVEKNKYNKPDIIFRKML